MHRRYSSITLKTISVALALPLGFSGAAAQMTDATSDQIRNQYNVEFNPAYNKAECFANNLGLSALGNVTFGTTVGIGSRTYAVSVAISHGFMRRDVTVADDGSSLLLGAYDRTPLGVTTTEARFGLIGSRVTLEEYNGSDKAAVDIYRTGVAAGSCNIANDVDFDPAILAIGKITKDTFTHLKRKPGEATPQ